jgi:hypothetical protein
MSIDTRPKNSTRATLPRLRRRPGRDAEAPAAPDATDRLPDAARLAGRRNPRWIALGVVALCLGGLLSYVIYSQVAAQSTVVAMTHTVHRGAVIQQSDLTTTTLSGTTKVSVVPAEQLSSLVGKRAAFDLVEGALVPAAATVADPLPATGRAVIGVKLNPGRAPVGLLPPSAPVRLVALPSSDQAAGQAAAPTQAYFGRVVDTADGVDGTSTLVNVDVAAADAPAIALLAAQDRIAILRDADK